MAIRVVATQSRESNYRRTSEMSTEALPCIACGKQLHNVFDDCENQASDGLAFRSYGQYGSRVFDPMDGQFLEVNICDSCLQAYGTNRVLLGRETKPIASVKLVPWYPGLKNEPN